MPCCTKCAEACKKWHDACEAMGHKGSNWWNERRMSVLQRKTTCPHCANCSASCSPESRSSARTRSSGGCHGGSSGGSASGATDAGKPASLPTATTNLTLRVHADAKVWIEGHLTGSTGAVRNFGTRRLAQGEEWARNHHGEV